MNTIPTAEEVYSNFYFNYKGDENFILESMRNFAKLHVKAALEKASLLQKEIYINPISIKELHGYRKLNENADITKTLILNCYPENLIK